MHFRKHFISSAVCGLQIAIVGALAVSVTGAGALAANKPGVRAQAKQQQTRPSRSRLWAEHVFRCSRKYRSYDRVTDTYLHYTGVRKKCRE